MGINKVILLGRLGRDPEVRYTPSNTAVATISLATGERRKDATGQWVDHTEWHRLVCFGKLAERAKNYLKKGSQIYVEGCIRTNKWQDKDGKDRFTTEIVVGSMEFIGAKQGESFEGDSSFSSDSGFPISSLQSADSLSMPEPVSNESFGSFDPDDIPF